MFKGIRATCALIEVWTGEGLDTRGREIRIIDASSTSQQIIKLKERKISQGNSNGLNVLVTESICRLHVESAKGEVRPDILALIVCKIRRDGKSDDNNKLLFTCVLHVEPFHNGIETTEMLRHWIKKV